MAQAFGRNLKPINDRGEGYTSKINDPKEKPQPIWQNIAKEYHSADNDRNVDH